MESLTQWWQDVMEIPGAAWIIYPCLLVVFILIAWYVLQTLRNMALGGAPTSDDHLGTFRKMRDEGVLDPDEYKKLASLVPMPEIETKQAEASVDAATGPVALTEAAREALRKAAQERAAKSGQNEDQKKKSDSDATEEDAQSSES